MYVHVRSHKHTHTYAPDNSLLSGTDKGRASIATVVGAVNKYDFTIKTFARAAHKKDKLKEIIVIMSFLKATSALLTFKQISIFHTRAFLFLSLSLFPNLSFSL